MSADPIKLNLLNKNLYLKNTNVFYNIFHHTSSIGIAGGTGGKNSIGDKCAGWRLK